MTGTFSRIFTLALGMLIASPALAFAQSTSSTTTSGGVQVIDMNPPPAAPKKKSAESWTLKAPAPPTALPGGDAVVRTALALVGSPYRMGGTTPSAFDCSGFTQYVFRTNGVAIPRLADQQFYKGRSIVGDPLPGDLVFFQTYQYGPSHVGIYLGDGKFVSSIGKDVHVDTFESGYFRSRYLGARRYLAD